MADMTYAVHTRTCIYLLDEAGICGWALPTGEAPPIGAERCIGSQFVACLDLGVDGGLVGELRVGAAALFARHEKGRIVLLRTQPIERLELRSPEGDAEPEPEDDLPFGTDTMPLPEPSQPPYASPPAARPSAPPPPPRPPPPRHPTLRLPDTPPAEVRIVPPPPASSSGLDDAPTPTALLPGVGSGGALELDLEDLLSVSITEVTVSLPRARDFGAAGGRAPTDHRPWPTDLGVPAAPGNLPPPPKPPPRRA